MATVKPEASVVEAVVGFSSLFFLASLIVRYHVSLFGKVLFMVKDKCNVFLYTNIFNQYI